MNGRWLSATAVLAITLGVLPVFSSPASARSDAPAIRSFSPAQGLVGTTVIIEGTSLADATSVTFGRARATVVLDTDTEVQVQVPSDATTSAIHVTTPAGRATSRRAFVVTTPLAGAVNLASDGSGYCALLTSGGVDCWGSGRNGQLGNGVFYAGDKAASAYLVAVVGVGGSGTLAGAVSLVSDDDDGSGYCALLSSSGVDCWGDGFFGQLGNGVSYTSGNEGSAVPVAVLGVGGSGTLSGVASLASVGTGYCALLETGAVDCWGTQTGAGSVAASSVPVAVLGVGGSGTLTGVASLTGGEGYTSYCAALTSGGVDCWGYGNYGQLGNGVFYATGSEESAVPVAVEGVGASGTLDDVVSLASDPDGYCAVLTSGGLDCWGIGFFGQLGNGVFYNNVTPGETGSAVPVEVLGVGGTGSLSGVAAVASGANGFCALLTSNGVDCWGFGYNGELGDGISDKTGHKGSAVPVAVVAGGGGTLGGVASVVGNQKAFCALLTSNGVDCWGAGNRGQLGDGGETASAVPVSVLGVGGSSWLSGVAGLATDQRGFCSLLTSGGVDCWGQGNTGQLGDGVFNTTGSRGSALPVAVVMQVTTAST